MSTPQDTATQTHDEHRTSTQKDTATCNFLGTLPGEHEGDENHKTKPEPRRFICVAEFLREMGIREHKRLHVRFQG